MLFAPADVSPYGNGIQPSEGYFFVFDGLHWSISTPAVATIGKPDFVRQDVYRSDPTQEAQPFNQASTHDTGQLTAAYTEGNRIEFGRVWGHRGWFFSGYRLNNQTQMIVTGTADVAFEDFDIATGIKALDGLVENLDPDAQDPTDPTLSGTITEIRSLPVTFDELIMKNRVETWSVELMGMHRFHQLHHGGVFEVFAGARYLEFNESFDVNGLGDELTTTTGQQPPGQQPPAQPGTQLAPIPPILADSVWNTIADNHIVGPQIGMRYFRRHNRWMISTEGRFLAGINFQNIRQSGVLGSRLTAPGTLDQPYLLGPADVDHTEFLDEWSPLVELRAELRYQLTRSISVRFGWTGFWVDGIARPSNMINYEIAVPNRRPNPVDYEMMGILTENNQQSVFAQGFSIGLDVNR